MGSTEFSNIREEARAVWIEENLAAMVNPNVKAPSITDIAERYEIKDNTIHSWVRRDSWHNELKLRKVRAKQAGSDEQAIAMRTSSMMKQESPLDDEAIDEIRSHLSKQLQRSMVTLDNFTNIVDEIINDFADPEIIVELDTRQRIELLRIASTLMPQLLRTVNEATPIIPEIDPSTIALGGQPFSDDDIKAVIYTLHGKNLGMKETAEAFAVALGTDGEKHPEGCDCPTCELVYDIEILNATDKEEKGEEDGDS